MIKEKISDLYEKALMLAMEYLPMLFLAIVVLILGWWMLKRVSKITEVTMEKKQIDPSLRTFLKTTINIFLKVILLISVAGMIGIHTTSFVAILGAAGLAIGLALQGSLSNFAGGALILVFKPFKVGDIVEIQSYTGEVKDIQIFNTVLQTQEHKTVIIPNGALANGVVVNYSATPDIRAEIQLKVSGENSIDKVKTILEKIISSDERIYKVPAPQILVSGFGSNTINFIVRFFTLVGDKVTVEAETWEKIKREFDKEGIQDISNFTFVKNVV